MNDEFPLIIIVPYQTCSILMLIVISVLQHVPLFIDRIWLLLMSLETEVGPHTTNKACSDSTRNEQLKTSDCLMKFDGSSANAMFFSSREILLFLEWFWQILWMSSSTFVPVHQYNGQARTQWGCIHPPDLKRCWHGALFHWKSSPKYFGTAHYLLTKYAEN